MQIFAGLGHVLPYDIVPITQENYAIARDVFSTNPDYFALFGNAANDESILAAMCAVPDGFDISGKYFAALCQNGAAIAIIDLLADYPDTKDLWLGLLMVHGGMLGKGVGNVIINGVLQAASLTGFDNIHLGVIEANTDAIRFWNKAGFVHERTSGDVLIFSKECS